MNQLNHDGVRRNATALVISFLALGLLAWLSVTWLGQPGLVPLGIVIIAAMSLALGLSLVLLLARFLRR